MFRLASRAVLPGQGVLCPSTCAMVTSKSFVAPLGARAISFSPWGSDHWRHDKNTFKIWCTEAMLSGTKAQREMYGFLATAFGDVDGNRDGLINASEFDMLCEKVAALPRRYGMAPSWEKEYKGDVEARTKARAAMFHELDTRNGPARGTIGLKQFVRWARDHIMKKVSTLDMKSKVDFNHVEDYDEETFMNYLEHALHNPTSGAYSSLYQFLLTVFVESDKQCKGTIDREEFDVLVDRAAVVPRQFGLAPMGSSKELRDKFFAAMDDNNSGTITFRKFLAWTVEHSKLKISKQRSGEGYKK